MVTLNTGTWITIFQRHVHTDCNSKFVTIFKIQDMRILYGLRSRTEVNSMHYTKCKILAGEKIIIN
jgi:hypothetical protein